MPQDTIELIAKSRGQLRDDFWILPRVLACLGHGDDETLDRTLTLLMPLSGANDTRHGCFGPPTPQILEIGNFLKTIWHPPNFVKFHEIPISFHEIGAKNDHLD